MLSLEKELYKVAKVRLRNDDDIYDAIQETTIKAFKFVKKLKQNQYFKTWIIKILINESNNIYRRKNKRRIISFEELENNREIEYSNIDNVEISLDFNFICNKLKYEDRIIIILYYMEGFSDKEIGKILKLKENTVKTKRIRAKQKIKVILDMGEKNNG